jgi:glycosyltransferase involved in cell wall biosynthesis
MNLPPQEITIAVPVYKRRQYIKQAVASALNQSIPVRVVVVEDPSSDSTLETFVRDEFGSRIEFVKSPKWRGQFGNLNLCLDVCTTEWISILHDDDYLAPGFVEGMIELVRHAPNRALYRGQTILVDEHGQPEPNRPIPRLHGDWQGLALQDILYGSFPFAGQMFKLSTAKELGGFHEHCFFCGDWEMWARLIARGGAAQTGKVLAYCRSHDSWDRITNTSMRKGRHLATTYVQQKRILALLPRDSKIGFDRSAFLRDHPIPVRFLLRYGASLSPRLLAYHVGLLLLSRPPHQGYAIYQRCAKVGGVRFVRLSSMLWNRLNQGASQHLL